MKLECRLCTKWQDKIGLLETAIEQASAGEMTLDDLGLLYCPWCRAVLVTPLYTPREPTGITGAYHYEAEDVDEWMRGISLVKDE